jgi:Glycosyltransferase family 9 (heptosyltransferase)
VRVLLVRLDGIGDAAVCVPLVAALRAAGHEVGVALTTRNAGLFMPEAIVAEHVLERIPWPAHGSTAASTARARAEIAAMRYDAALIASEEPEAFELAAPVRERIGFTTGWARPLKTLWVRARTTRTVSRSQRIGGEDAHEVEILYRLGAGLVRDERPPADPSSLRPQLLSRDVIASRSKAEPTSRDSGTTVVQTGPKWTAVGISPQTQRAIFAALAPRARLIAAPSDAGAVREQTGILPETFATTRGWIEALASARTVLTVDTGAAHVAGMLGTPVVDVFPDAHFEAQVRRWRPWASPYRAVRASEVDGGPHGRFIETVFDGL